MRIRKLILIMFCFALSGCTSTKKIIFNKNQPYKKMQLMTTGYCKCQICCGWERNWMLQPVYSYGKNKGKPKKIGVTSSGTKAVKGTIAADLNVLPYGTVLYIPDYGWGQVEDIGSAIKGNHIDLFFNSHNEALKWGRKTKIVHVWLPHK